MSTASSFPTNWIWVASALPSAFPLIRDVRSSAQAFTARCDITLTSSVGREGGGGGGGGGVVPQPLYETLRVRLHVHETTPTQVGVDSRKLPGEHPKRSAVPFPPPGRSLLDLHSPLVHADLTFCRDMCASHKNKIITCIMTTQELGFPTPKIRDLTFPVTLPISELVSKHSHLLPGLFVLHNTTHTVLFCSPKQEVQYLALPPPPTFFLLPTPSLFYLSPTFPTPSLFYLSPTSFQPRFSPPFFQPPQGQIWETGTDLTWHP